MTKPLRIKPKGSESTYILESAMPSAKGERVKYDGETYVKEELPPEFVMLEGVAYKRGMSVADYNRKAMMEGASGVKPPSKIKIKGTDTVLESVDNDKLPLNYMTGRREARKVDSPEVASVRAIRDQIYPIMEQLEKLQGVIDKGFSTRDEQIKKAYLYSKNGLYALSIALGAHIVDLGGEKY